MGIVLFLSDTRKKLVHNTMNTTIFSPAKTFRATTTTTTSTSSFSRRSCCSKSRRAVVVTNVTKWMLDAPDCEKARTGNLDRVQSAPRHCPIAAIDVNRLCQSSGGVLQVDNNAVHGSFMLSNKGHTMKIGQKKKMKVKPGQLIIFEDGEAYEVYRNTEAHA